MKANILAILSIMLICFINGKNFKKNEKKVNRICLTLLSK